MICSKERVVPQAVWRRECRPIMISADPQPFSTAYLGFVLPAAREGWPKKTAEPHDFHDLQKKASSDPKCCFSLNVSKAGFGTPHR